MEIIKIKIEDLKPYKNNAKLHPEWQIEQIIKSIEQFGFNDPIAVWGEDNIIVEGHGRLEAVKKLGYTEVECIRLDHLTEEERKAYTLAHNKTTMNSDFDFDLLKLELDDIKGIDMSDFGFELDLDEDDEEVVEDDFEVVLPEEPKSKLGDIYQLGNHRLMCGDSTSIDDVEKLMNGVKADMVFTDPPYGININNTNGKIIGDGDLNVFNKCLKTIEMFSKLNAHLYIYFGVQFISECVSELKKYFKQTNILVQHITHENKPSPSGYFKNNYEMCYFSNREGKDFNYGLYDVSETTLEDKRYNGDGKLKSYKALSEIKSTEHNLKAVHPTQKTIEICSFYINISSNKNDLILDLFGGSGSTLIACEQLNRKCYMMELDCKYIQVIIERYIAFTGNKVYRLNDDGTKTDWEEIK